MTTSVISTGSKTGQKKLSMFNTLNRLKITEGNGLLMQGEKCEFMPNRMFKYCVAQGCMGMVKCK